MLSYPEWILVAVCLAVSTFNASVGTTGGVTFAAMASVLPPTAVVPVHGLVEGVASAFRWGLLRTFVDRPFLIAFVLGGLVGFVLGWPLVGRFSADTLQVTLGAFILIVAWAPFGRMLVPAGWAGGVTSCLTVLVGATGPLVTAILARRLDDHRDVIGTQAACTTFQHGVKSLLFGVWGFAFYDYGVLIVALVVAIVAGTWAGKRVLLRLPQKLLRNVLKLIVTVLGVRLVWTGLAGAA